MASFLANPYFGFLDVIPLRINNFYQELHRDRGRLEKARVVKEAEMEEHQARCNEIQVLKFGQLIDLEMVDKVCI